MMEEWVIHMLPCMGNLVRHHQKWRFSMVLPTHNPIIVTCSGAPHEQQGVCLSTTAYKQLQDQLLFIHDHDEHVDIATGTQFIDDSLSDEILESMEDAAAAVEVETESSEVQTESAIHQHLHAALQDIKKQIDLHGQPDCYRQGDFFHRTKHAVFILHDAALKGLQPDRLCARDIFVWLPPFLPGAPDYFKCTCGGRLTKNGTRECSYFFVVTVYRFSLGYNDNPIARHVKSFPTDYWLLTNRFLCKASRQESPGCGKSWQGTDPHIIAQLPHWVVMAFPGM
jgi:hypothetical protein